MYRNSNQIIYHYISVSQALFGFLCKVQLCRIYRVFVVVKDYYEMRMNP